jgi:hypothetical protein
MATAVARATANARARNAGRSATRRLQSGGTYGREVAHVAALLGRGAPTGANPGYEKEQIVFGEYINADVYLPSGLRQSSGKKAPAVLWLPPLSFSHGYGAGYKRGEAFPIALARQGYVVFCWDPIGTGRRVGEAEFFYDRHPRWSLLGKMVRDAQAAWTYSPRCPTWTTSRSLASATMSAAWSAAPGRR